MHRHCEPTVTQDTVSVVVLVVSIVLVVANGAVDLCALSWPFYPHRLSLKENGQTVSFNRFLEPPFLNGKRVLQNEAE